MPRNRDLEICEDDHDPVCYAGSDCPACEMKTAGKQEICNDIESEIGDIDDAMDTIRKEVFGVQSLDDLPHLKMYATIPNDLTEVKVWLNAEKLALLYQQMQRIGKSIEELEGLDDDL